MDDDNGRWLRLLLVGVLLSIVVGGTVDIILDRPDTWRSFHVFFELLLIAIALTTATALWLGWWRSRAAVQALRRRLDERQIERDRWRANAERALAGLREAIETQLEAWGLTPVEREIALRLLQGQSHKAIAIETHRSERTVRQHAVAIYQKAGVGGRAELAAFFLSGIGR